MSNPQIQQQNTKSYWDALEEKRKAEKTSQKLTPAELQKFISASERDPSLLRQIPSYKEIEDSLGQIAAENATIKESGYLMENINAQYGPYARFNQKMAVGVDVLVKASENRLHLYTRDIDMSHHVVNQRQGLTGQQKFLIALSLMFLGGVILVPGASSGFLSWLAAPVNDYIVMGFLAIVGYFAFIRPSRRQR